MVSGPDSAYGCPLSEGNDVVLPGKSYSFDEITQILLKRWWIVLLPFVIGSVGGIHDVPAYPRAVWSETLIMVVPQRVPDSYVKPTVTGTVEDRLTSINDQILSRSRLERVITDFDLYRDARASRHHAGRRRADARRHQTRAARSWPADLQGRVRQQRSANGAQSHRTTGVAVYRGEPPRPREPGRDTRACSSRVSSRTRGAG